MSDMEELTSFAVMRPLLLSTMKELKEATKEQRDELVNLRRSLDKKSDTADMTAAIGELKTQVALLNQKVALYAAAASGGGVLVFEMGSRLL